MNEHLRSYLVDSLGQIIRKEKRLEQYEQQVNKSRERAIEQKSLYNQMVKNNASEKELLSVKEREEKDTQLLEFYTKRIAESRDMLALDINELYSNTKELSKMEMDAGGFYTHSLLVVEDAVYNDKTTNIEMTLPTSHVKGITPVYQTSWKDFSKLTIRKSEVSKPKGSAV